MTTETPIFTSSDTFHITGRGDVYMISRSQHVGDERDLMNQTVVIDGTRFTVTGIEGCLVLGHEGGNCSRPLGLLVKPEEN